MRIALSVILLFTGLAASAPIIDDDRHVAAKQFFGAIATHFRDGNNEKLFDTLHAKWEHFYPGLVAPDTMKDLRAAFLAFMESQTKNHTEVPVMHLLTTARAVDKIEKEIKRRIWWLNAEGRKFVEKAFASVPHKFDGETKLVQLYKKFAAFRAEFDALAPSTKKKLAKRFEIFAHLDEVGSLILTYDDLLWSAMLACKNLIGFSGCDHVEKVYTEVLPTIEMETNPTLLTDILTFRD